MRIIKILSVFVLVAFLLQSCDKGELEIKVTEGGLVEVQSSSIFYVVGNQGPYTASLNVLQGEVKTTQIEVYKTFHSLGKSSEQVLFKTFPITDSKSVVLTFDFTFDDLRDGLTIDGASLPANDGDYNIGDYWEFEYRASADGRTVIQSKKTKVSVATRYAGKYKFVEGEYWRVGVLSSDGDYWTTTADEWIFESVDATTYRMVGLCAWLDNELYFQIDNDGNITYPDNTPDGDPQILNDQPLITCALNPTDLTHVCGKPYANTVINDDVEGKDVLVMCFGYYTDGSGPREFYQKMEKIVD